MTLSVLRDMIELWGYNNDLNGGVLKAQESAQDYCLIRRSDGGLGFVVEVYDTPSTLLRDIGDYFVGTKIPARFELKAPSTKARKYGR